MGATSNEAAASLRVLLAMARADGHIHQREQDVLAFLAHHTADIDAETFERASEDRRVIDVEAECALITDERAKRMTYSAAMIIADIDEERSPAETALLARIHGALGLPGVPEGRFVAMAHHARMAQLTARLTEADDEFSRAVAAATAAGELDEAAHQALSDARAAKKDALFAAFFSGGDHNPAF